MQRKSLQLFYWAVSAVMLAGVCLFAIPDVMAVRQLELVTLRELSTPQEHYYLCAGNSLEITAAPVPLTAESTLVWTSTDSNVVSVDTADEALDPIDEGKPVSSADLPRATLLCKAAGNATVTVAGENGVCCSVAVTVIYPPLPPDSDLPPIYYDRLPVVNVNNSIGEDYIPELVDVPNKYESYPNMKLTPDALEAYERFYADGLAATGQRLKLMSAYRSYTKQKSLYNQDVNKLLARGYTLEKARAQVGKTQQPPGSSEHQLGVSLDLGEVSNNFGETALGKWSHEHAHEYGFVLRYPADKESVTGISYESWHFRYVGVEHAEYIHSHGLCMEEYVALQDEAAKAASEYASTLSEKDIESYSKR